MSLTQTEKLGFSKNVLELIEKESAVLRNAGFNPDEIHAILTGKYERASQANARQEDLKRQSKQATEDVVAFTDDLYRAASGYLDAAIAAAGKGSPTAKNFQRLRSRIRDSDDGPDGAPPVEPVREGTR